jgi:type IV pilus assembly protein PilY1
LYVLDAATGAILNKISTANGDVTTPSGLAKISAFADNPQTNNTTKWVYGGDLNGNIWRFDLTAVIPTVQRLATLVDGSTPARPQSVTTRPELTKFAAGFVVLYVGTGRYLASSDLGDPAALVPPQPYAYQQSFYGFKDTGADLGNLRLPAAKLVQQTISIINAANRTVLSTPVDWTLQNGWYVDFNPANASPGERVNIDAQLVKGTLLVVTNVPNSDACNAGGESWLYQLGYKSGTYIPGTLGGIAGSRLGNALTAGFVVYRLPSGQMKITVIDVTGNKPTQGVNTSGSGSSGKRVSWREITT